MSIFINNLIDVGDKRTLWIDAEKQASININLIYLDTHLIVFKKEVINANYVDNYLWKASIPPINKEGVILGRVVIKENGNTYQNSFALKTIESKNIFIYLSSLSKSSNITALQLNWKAQIIDEIEMRYMQYNFFVGKISKIEQSVICVDNVCTVFLNKGCNNNIDNTIDKLILQELELLKEQLERCKKNKEDIVSNINTTLNSKMMNTNVILNNNATLDSKTINHSIKQNQVNEVKTRISSDKISTTNTSHLNIKNNSSKVSIKNK